MEAMVTGGTGFVGSHLVRVLVEAGHSVRVLHRATSKLDALAGIPFTSATGDITDERAVRAACAGCDWVFHAAAVADYWRADVSKMLDANIEGTRRVLAAAHAEGVRRVVFTSSAAAMGMRKDAVLVDETLRFNGSSTKFPYGYSKAMAEIVALEAIQGGLDVVITNPVVVMGPGDLNIISGGFVLNIARLGWAVPVTTGGVAVTDVRDVARWHLRAAIQGRTGERYLLGTQNSFYPDWFALIADVAGVARPGFVLPSALLPFIGAGIDLLKARGIELPIDGTQTRLGGQRIYFDFRKAWAELGEPIFTMRQSVEDTYRWYVEHGYLHNHRPNRAS